MLDYIGSLPMWLQVAIVIIILLIVIALFAAIIKLILAVIYKVRHAEKIKAGPGGVEIEDVPESQPENVVPYKASTRKFTGRKK